jgi:tetratricopeptide (TPR) repeat protein
MKLYLKLLLLSFFILLNTKNFGQTQTEIKDLSAQGEAKLKLEDYEEALEIFLQLVALDPKNETYNYNTSVCYLNTKINKAKADTYLENIIRN